MLVTVSNPKFHLPQLVIAHTNNRFVLALNENASHKIVAYAHALNASHPWSTTSPNGYPVPVLLACFPSIPSMV